MIEADTRRIGMNRLRFRRPVVLGLIALALAATLSGCSKKMSVSFQPEPQFPEQYSEEGCTIRFFRSNKSFVDRCELGGTVSVRDNGFSVDCTTDRVREEVRLAACRIGADRAVLNRRNNPMSTCIETDADLYICPKAAPEIDQGAD